MQPQVTQANPKMQGKWSQSPSAPRSLDGLVKRLEQLDHQQCLTPLRVACELVNYYDDLCGADKGFDRVSQFLHRALLRANPMAKLVVQQLPAGQEPDQLRKMTEELQPLLHACARSYERHGTALPMEEIRLLVHHGISDVRGGSLPFLFPYEVVRELSTNGRQRLLRCPRCHRLGLADKRSRYCSAKCRNKARARRHAEADWRLEYQALYMYQRNFRQSNKKGLPPSRAQLRNYLKLYRERRKQRGMTVSSRLTDNVVEQAVQRIEHSRRKEAAK